MKHQKFLGTGIAVVTPMQQGAVDYPALGKIIDHLIDGKVEYIVSLGTTGEATSLSPMEINQIIRYTAEKVNGRIPIVFGAFGGNYTEEVITRIKNADLSAVDAIMSSSPAYVKPNQEGIFQHYMQIAEASTKPVIIYNVPSRTAMGLMMDTILRLAESHPNFLGVKEAGGNMASFGKLIKYAPEDFLLISGDDFTAFHSTAMGGHGVISVIGNAFPKEFSEMIRLTLKGNMDQAAAIHLRLLDLYPLLFVEGSPAGIKCVMNQLNLCSEEVRLPMVPVSEETKMDIVKAMENAGF